MSARSGQAITIDFPINTTSGPANADSTPTGTLVVNGTDNGASVTITNKATGIYKAAFTLPTLAIGDFIQLRIAATIGGIVANSYVWTESKDTLIDASGVVDANVTQVAGATQTARDLGASTYVAPGVAPSFVQGTGDRITNGNTTLSKAFVSTTVTGNLIAVGVTGFMAGSTAQLPVISDNYSNRYKLISSSILSGGSQYMAIFVCDNATGGASHSITVTQSVGGYISLGIAEFSGMGSLIAPRGWNRSSGSSTAVSSGSVPIGATVDLLLGLASDGNWNQTYTKGSGFNAIFEATGSGTLTPINFVYKTGLSADTAIDWTLGGSVAWFACGAALKSHELVEVDATDPPGVAALLRRRN